VRYAGAAAGSVTGIRLLTFAERKAPRPRIKSATPSRDGTLLKEVPPLPAMSALRWPPIVAQRKIRGHFRRVAGRTEAGQRRLLQGIREEASMDCRGVGPLAESLPRLLATADDVLHSFDPLLKKTSDAVDTVKAGVGDLFLAPPNCWTA